MPNIYEQFKALLPGDLQLIARVLEAGESFSVVQHFGGAPVGDTYGCNGVVERVQGTAAVDTMVFIKGGVIIGPAPSLPVVEVILYGL